MSRRVLIAGGGIGGLALAGRLLRADWEVVVCERTPQWSPVGAGITLSRNALRALEDLVSTDELIERGWPVQRSFFTDARGRVLSSIDFDEHPEMGPLVSIHRAELHEVLLASAQGASFHLGTTIARWRSAGEPIEVELEGGASFSVDLLVGADGIRSQLRADLASNIRPRYSGYTCWRFVASNTGLDATYEMWGRGSRLGLVPLGSRGVYAYATLNAPANSEALAAIDVGSFRELFSQFRGPARAVLDSLPNDTQLISNDLEDVHLPSWSQGAATLLGDAAHATTPNMGQGAAMALEDAWALSQELAESDPAEAARRFETRRRPRVEWVQRQSWNLGKVAQWENAAARWVRDLGMRATPTRVLLRRMSTLFDGEI